VAVDSSGDVYVADADNNRIRKITITTSNNVETETVSTIAGTAGTATATTGSPTPDGTGTAATFSAPAGVAVFGTNLYVADTGNHLIRKITSAGVVTRFAGKLDGSGASAAGDDNGAGLTVAEFSSPQGVAADSDGNLYVADTGNHRIRKIELK